MVRIAVLGCGRIGRMHAANIAAHPRAELGGVFDVHRPAAAEISAPSYFFIQRSGGSYGLCGRMKDTFR